MIRLKFRSAGKEIACKSRFAKCKAVGAEIFDSQKQQFAADNYAAGS